MKGDEQMTSRDEMIGRIVDAEWIMFDAVNQGEARADCQEDKEGFVAMRRAQFLAWSEAACAAYLKDLDAAAAAGRNLVTEKYIHMMKTTEPSKYDALLHQVKLPTAEAEALAGEICALMLDETETLWAEFPYVSGSGRPLYSTQDFGGVTSVETYQLGELLTYSADTLTALKAHILALRAEGGSLSRDILENTVKFYGFPGLTEAEAATKERIDAIGIQFSFGCGCDDDTCSL